MPKEDSTISSELLLGILRDYWSDLPNWFGEQWYDVETELLQLYQTLNQNNLTERDTVVKFPEVFERCPRAREQLGQLLQDGGLIHRGVGSAAPVTRYAELSCQRRIWRREREVPVLLYLRRQGRQGACPVDLDPARPVHALLDAPGFDIIGDRKQIIDIPKNGDSAPAAFLIRPTDVGTFDITVDLFQDHDLVCSIAVEVQVIDDECSDDPVERRAELSGERPVRPADFTLLISHNRTATPEKLDFSLIDRRTDNVVDYGPTELPGDLTRYVSDPYRELIDMAHGVDAHAKGSDVELRGSSADRRLRQIGRSLWADLIPPALKQQYHSERDQWRGKSIIVMSDEPYVPWELVWPWDADGEVPPDLDPWCITMRMTRWLRKSSKRKPNTVPRLQFSVRAMAVLSPSDSDLEYARHERDFLRNMQEENEIDDVTPQSQTYEPVMDMLERDNYDWVHCSSHGHRAAHDVNAPAVILLHGGQSLTTAALAGPAGPRIRKQRPAFIFNACDAGYRRMALTDIDGWADRLISTGAGLFIGPLWPVRDRTAAEFGRALYSALLDGHPVADAVHRARLAARESGDPSWLAYTIYAHPNAEVTFGHRG